MPISCRLFRHTVPINILELIIERKLNINNAFIWCDKCSSFYGVEEHDVYDGSGWGSYTEYRTKRKPIGAHYI